MRNERKVIYFAWTKGAARVSQGEPYIASFRDSAGNPCNREVERISIISCCFHYANVVDTHDHLRQGAFDLEHKWVSFDFPNCREGSTKNHRTCL